MRAAWTWLRVYQKHRLWGATLQLLNQKQNENKVPKWFICRMHFKKLWLAWQEPSYTHIKKEGNFVLLGVANWSMGESNPQLLLPSHFSALSLSFVSFSWLPDNCNRLRKYVLSRQCPRTERQPIFFLSRKIIFSTCLRQNSLQVPLSRLSLKTPSLDIKETVKSRSWNRHPSWWGWDKWDW